VHVGIGPADDSDCVSPFGFATPSL
jgi:hypothetical protein